MNETINTNDTLRVGVKLIKTGCIAMDGPGKGLPCVFPFKYDEVTYNTCTNRNKFLTNNIPWCSTKVNEGGYHIQGEGNWGNCDETCPLPKIGKVNSTKNCSSYRIVPLNIVVGSNQSSH